MLDTKSIVSSSTTGLTVLKRRPNALTIALEMFHTISDAVLYSLLPGAGRRLARALWKSLLVNASATNSFRLGISKSLPSLALTCLCN